MTVKISVIIPVYNASAYLDVLINSVTSQSFKDIEIIIIDDKSTDLSLALIQAHAEKDDRIKIIEHPVNSGLSASRNTGLANACGQYLAFADSDDFMQPNALSEWVGFMEKNDLDLLIGNAFRFVDDPFGSAHLPILNKQAWGDVKSGSQWIIDAVSVKEWPHYAWLQLIKRDVQRGSGIQFMEGIIHEDILWTMQIALNSPRISFFKEPLYGYRDAPASIMNENSNESIRRRCLSYLAIIDVMSEKAKEYPRNSLLRKALLRHCNRESGHLLGLVRKKVTDIHDRAAIAEDFFRRKVNRAILSGVSNISELWRALKCIYILRRYQ